VPPPPLDFNEASSDDDRRSSPLAPAVASGPQGGNVDRGDLLRRRIEFLGLKPEDSEEYKKVREGKLITGEMYFNS